MNYYVVCRELCWHKVIDSTHTQEEARIKRRHDEANSEQFDEIASVYNEIFSIIWVIISILQRGKSSLWLHWQMLPPGGQRLHYVNQAGQLPSKADRRSVDCRMDTARLRAPHNHGNSVTMLCLCMWLQLGMSLLRFYPSFWITVFE